MRQLALFLALQQYGGNKALHCESRFWCAAADSVDGVWVSHSATTFDQRKWIRKRLSDLFSCIAPVSRGTNGSAVVRPQQSSVGRSFTQSPAMSLLARSTSSSSAAARSASCSSRVKPFTPAVSRSSRRAQKLVARAAEEETIDAEAAAEQQALTDEFAFNLNDAKKGNQWQPSDVEAALAYYEGEKFLQGSTELPYEAEFVTNPLSAYAGGPEDSSWLQDVDNNEAYETDDYALAGIPEAAPKVKRNQREDEDDNEEELRQLEEEKITAAAFDDVEGFAEEEEDNPEAAWNWRLEGDAGDEEVVVTGVYAFVYYRGPQQRAS